MVKSMNGRRSVSLIIVFFKVEGVEEVEGVEFS